LVDHMAVIFPFEAQFYKAHQVTVSFVGHPLLDTIPIQENPPSLQYAEDTMTIGLVPGSREKEVTTLLPVMLESARIMKQKIPTVRFAVSCARSVSKDVVSEIVAPYLSDLSVDVINGPVTQVFKKSLMIIAASGTVTLEAALYGVPSVIVYKLSPMSYWLGKRLIKVKYIGIVNLIAKKELMPELIQDDASPAKIAETVATMVTDKSKIIKTREEMLRIRELLGGPGASDRVACIALQLCEQKDAGQGPNKKSTPDGYIRGIFAKIFRRG